MSDLPPPADPLSHLTLPPGARPPTPPPLRQAPPQSVPQVPNRPYMGRLVAGYGCYVNPDHVSKLEVANTGNGFTVIAHLTTQPAGAVEQGANPRIAKLSRPFETETEALDALDRLCMTLYLVIQVEGDPHGCVRPPTV